MITEQDRLEIMNQLGRFARILDERLWDRVGEVFAPDISFDYATGVEEHGIDALLATFRRYLDVCGPSQHHLGSIILTVEGEVVTTSAYVRAYHEGKGTKSGRFLDTLGEYVDQWKRHGDKWLCFRRDARWIMNAGDSDIMLPEGKAFVLTPVEGGGFKWEVGDV